MAKLYYQGHGSYRITTDSGVVVYFDPYAGDGYDVPGDIVLVTHQHGDHNQIHRVPQKPDCLVITQQEALAGGTHQRFEVKGIEIQAVQAQNKNHSPSECVGFILTMDGVSLYGAGDTSKTAQMADFARLSLDYALLCCDGVYNMDIPEAVECAAIIGARHAIPIHIQPGALYDPIRAEQFNAPNRILLAPGETLAL